MGLLLSVFWNKTCRILFLGLDNAGKTTILYRYVHERTVATVPTLGFNVESLQMGRFECTVWDIAGQDRSRVYWRHYYHGVDGIVFMVDSSDSERFALVRHELQTLLNEAMLDKCPLLVFANKQDLPNAVGEESLRFELWPNDGQPQQRLWNIQPTCGLTGDGLDLGWKWMERAIVQQRKRWW